MKFKMMNRLGNIKTADDLKDIRAMKEEIVRINRALNELTDTLEAVLSSIDEDNVKPGVLKAAGQRPIGSLEFRYMPDDNAGYGYGTWQLLEDTIRTAKSFIYIYIRIK